MKKSTYMIKLAIIIIGMTGATQAYAQQVLLNSDGEKIVEYSDGSWRYYQPSDSIYEVKDEILFKEPSKAELDQQEQNKIRLENERKLKEERDRTQKAQDELNAMQEQLRLAKEERQKLEQAALERQAIENRERATLKEQLRIEQERKIELEQAEMARLDQEEADHKAKADELARLERQRQEEADKISKEQEQINKKKLKQAEQNRMDEERRLKKEEKEREKKEKDELKALQAKLKLEQELKIQAQENERKRIEIALKEKEHLEREIQKEKERKIKRQKKEEDERLRNERKLLEAQLQLEKDLTERAERESDKKREDALKEKERLEKLLREEQQRNQIDPLESEESVSSEESAQVTPGMTYAQKMKSIEDLRKNYTLKAKFERDRYGNAQAKRIYVDQELKKAKDNQDAVGEDQMNRLKEQLDQAKSDEKRAKKRSQKATKKASKAIDVSHQGANEQITWYEKEIKSIAEMKMEEEKAIAEEINNQKNKTHENANSRGGSSLLKKIEDYENPSILPPKRECHADDSVDDFTGKKRRDTRLETFLVHTSDQMRPHLKGESYITCDANLTTTAGYTFINMNLVIANEKANTTFGGLPKNARIQFTFIDGSLMTLSNRRRDQGKIDQLNKSTTYLVQLAIEKSAEKSLRNKLLDKVKIFWGKGFEEYDVTNLDFFNNQIDCLRS